MSGHGEGGEHEVGLERRDALDVGSEVGTDARQAADHRRREVGVVVDADQEVLAAERAHDLGVGAGERDDAHAAQCSLAPSRSLSAGSGLPATIARLS